MRQNGLWRYITTLMIVVPFLLVSGHFFWERYQVHRCIKMKGAYEYTSNTCVLSEVHEPIPYEHRHWQMLLLAELSMTLGFVSKLIGQYRSRASRAKELRYFKHL